MEPVIIIYGATGAMGATTARLLSEKACRLHLVGRDPDRLSALGGELSCPATCGDVTDPDLFSRVAADVEGPVAGPCSTARDRPKSKRRPSRRYCP